MREFPLLAKATHMLVTVRMRFVYEIQTVCCVECQYSRVFAIDAMRSL